MRAKQADYKLRTRGPARVPRTPEEIREDKRVRRNEDQARIKLEVILGYGGACACCSTSYLSHLTIDHVEGGGTAHRRVESQRKLYRRLRREGFPEGYQVLCWNCNWAKHVLGRCTCSDGEG